MTDKEKLEAIREFVKRSNDRHKRNVEKIYNSPTSSDDDYIWHSAIEFEDDKILRFIDSLTDKEI